ncbi:MAG TPA: FtsX-like permease family protein [Nocardioidaceae bacterium]|nr:FtsX-like permease family protein [Nocardioidaceae bacterium]
MGAGRTLRGAWWRRDLNLGLGLVIMVATAATVAAPTFAAAAVSSLVRERIATADPADTDVSWAIGLDDPGTDFDAAIGAARDLTAPAGRAFEPPVVGASVLLSWPAVDRDSPVVLAWHEGMCDQVVVTGICPTQPGDVLLPAGSTPARSYPVGESFVLHQRSASATLTVVGTWSPGDIAGGWYDPSRWTAGGQVPSLTDCGTSMTSQTMTLRTGPLLTDSSTLRSLGEVTVHSDAALAVSSDVDQVRRAATQADGWEADAAPRQVADGVCAAPASENDIDGVIGPIDTERSDLQRLGLGAAAGAVLVGVLAVVLITTISARRRRQEIALAKLRGIRGLRLAAVAVSEPLAVLLIGVVAGMPLGWGVGTVASRAWLGDVAVSLPTEALVWPAVVFGLAAIGMVVGIARTLREPVHQQLRPARRRTASPPVLLGRVATFVIAAVGVYQLRHDPDGQPPWWALALPVVVGLAAGMVAGWLIHLVARALTAWSRMRKGTGMFLAARHLVHGGDVASFVPFAMAATVLVVVAGSAWSAGTDWRDSVALMRTGGPVAIGSDLETDRTLAATHTADPDGQWLMTALSFPDESGRVYRRLYVDTERWNRVVAPSLDTTPSDAPSDIDPETLAALGRHAGNGGADLVRGTSVQVDVDMDTSWFDESNDAKFVLEALTSDGTAHAVSFGVPPQGRVSESVPVPFCASGCAVTDLRLDVERDSTSWISGRITIDEMTLGTTDLRGLGWQGNDDMSVQSHVSRGADGSLRIESRDGPVSLEPPTPSVAKLPVVLAGGLDLSDPTVVLEPGAALGIDGTTTPVDVVGRVESLPLIGDEGVLGDLSVFLDDDPSVPPLGEVVVIARADTPPTVLTALREAGVDAGASRSIESNRELLDQDPYAQGLRFFWLVAVLVAVIAMCTVATALVSQRQNRADTGAALRIVGMRRRQLRMAVVVEIALLAALMAGCGWVGAWAASWAALPSLPLGKPDAFEPSPATATGWTTGLMPGVLAAVVLSIVALVLLIPVTGRARPAARLRSGGE